MSDRIAVLNKGRLQQCAPPDDIYHLPANRFVATVVGSPPTNFIRAQVSAADGTAAATHPAFTLRAVGAGHPWAGALSAEGTLPEATLVGLRPEDLMVFDADPGGDAVAAKISVVEPLGSETVVDLLLGPDIIKAVVPPSQKLSEGQPVWIRFDPERIHFFDPASGLRRFTTGQTARLECSGRVTA